MNRCFFLTAFLLTILTAQAQVNTNQFGVNQVEQGNQIAVGAYTDYENTPFVPVGDWLPGVLVTPTGQRYAVTLLHYNADLDQPEYQLGERVFRPKFAVRRFVLGDSTTADARRFINGFPAVDQQTPASFYEVLHDGKTKLLKRIKATLLDVTGYNSATKQKRFDFNESYYLVKPGAAPIRLKRDKKSLLDALGDRAADLEAFVSREKLRFRDWDDVKKTLAFYDGL
jgi:hypothetical protein